MYSKIINIVLAVGIGILGLMMISQCQRANAAEKDAKLLWEDMTELNRTYKDKNGKLTTEVEEARITNQSLLQDLAKKENELSNIKGKVQSLTKINRSFVVTDTIIETIFQEMPGDTITTDSVVYIYPVYTRTISNRWFDLELEIGRLLTKYELNLRDDLIITHTKRRKLFKPDEYLMTVKSASPYVNDQEVEHYSIKESPKKWSIGAHVGYGLNSNLELSPNVSIGLNYQLLQL